MIDFASANDTGFTILGVKSHAGAAGTMPRSWNIDVVLPSAPCPACTLRLRQLMLTADVPDAMCPPATIPAGDTYYSCSNVILTGGDAGTVGGGGLDGPTASGGVISSLSLGPQIVRGTSLFETTSGRAFANCGN